MPFNPSKLKNVSCVRSENDVEGLKRWEGKDTVGLIARTGGGNASWVLMPEFRYEMQLVVILVSRCLVFGTLDTDACT